ncbi:uncharacterized protein LOC127878672 [Dreissena polymorpha]|uniref:uncharacterized protein LOC127878672 n=1 Tax=Dreissena polymorpha TaxID=45954 RepID=UPI002263FB8A|nr:uncharacterized protein LOC127878672 [Dreissena polymorpha]
MEKKVDLIAKAFNNSSQSTSGDYSSAPSTRSSPLNAAFILEEYYLECSDIKVTAHVVFLDAKSAFDVVDHCQLLLRLYHAGISDGHWLLLKSLHEHSSSAVRYTSQISDSFRISQGVRQGGILSTDLYRLYVNPLLDRLVDTGRGGRISTVLANSSACADDVCLIGRNHADVQLMIDMSLSFANEERYLLQPNKTVALNIKPSNRTTIPHSESFTLGKINLNYVDTSVHLWITRTTSVCETAEINVEGNNSQARRALYSFLGAGLQGHNGLDHKSMLDLYKSFVLPVLTYVLEVTRLPTRFRLLTGTYILKVNRSRYNQCAIDAVCPNC